MVTFGVPLALYAVWLAWLTKRMRFLPLLLLIVPTVWLLQWPTWYGPRAEEEVGPMGDVVINGFVFLGWIYGIMGCIPVILLEVVRSLMHWIRVRHAREEDNSG